MMSCCRSRCTLAVAVAVLAGLGTTIVLAGDLGRAGITQPAAFATQIPREALDNYQGDDPAPHGPGCGTIVYQHTTLGNTYRPLAAGESTWDEIEISTLNNRNICQMTLQFFAPATVPVPYTVTIEIFNDFPTITANACDLSTVTLLGSGSAVVNATGVQAVVVPITMTGVLPDGRLLAPVPPGCGDTAIPGDQFPNDDFFYRIRSTSAADAGPIIAAATSSPTIGCNDTAVGICGGPGTNGLFIGFQGGTPGRYVNTIVANNGGATTGRCCDAAGACTETTAAGCVAPSLFSGLGSSCTGPGFTGDPCVGSCCTPGGTCSLSTAAGCVAPNLFGGLGSNCDGGPCTGKCCPPDGFCVTVAPIDCVGAGFVFSGLGTACDPQTPEECLGRCCLPDGGCIADGPAPCVANGGTFGGVGVECGDASACRGRCCIGTTCSPNLSPNECAAAPGGPGTLTLGQPCDTFTVFNFDLAATPVAIPDGVAGPAFGANATNVQNVTGVTGNISDLNVDIKINHTFVGDLAVDITHPNGTTVTVIDLMGHAVLDCLGCGNPNIDVILDDEGTGGAIETQCNATNPTAASPPNFTPANALSAFDGLPPNGLWTITARDGCAVDTGSLVRWSLHFLQGTSTACAPQCACKGDMNGSGAVNGADINRFSQCVAAGPAIGSGCACADMNGSGTLTTADVTPFVNHLISGVTPCVP